MSDKPIFLSGSWNDLLMANYEVEESLLMRHLPYHTELDRFEGKFYVSLVGFMFNSVRIKGLSIPFHINFPEVNLRFYVRYKTREGWKRGVVFVREIVPRPAIAFVANTLYKERYAATPMRTVRTLKDERLSLQYEWKWKNRWNEISAVSKTSMHSIEAGSLEEFITEHYWGYSGVGERVTNEYGVEHPRWDLYGLESYRIICDFGLVYGNEFAFLNHATPASVFHAVGSPILIRHKTTLRG